jgi:transcriptional regulator with XRE-family HTH domain
MARLALLPGKAYHAEMQPTMTLAELRAARELRQVELAVRLNVPQSAVSRMESRGVDRMTVAGLARYIEALGGKLELIARFGSDSVSLS